MTGALEHEVLAGVNYQDVELTSSRAFLRQGVLNAFNPVYGNGVPSMAELDAVRGTTESESEYWGFYAHDQISWNNWIANFGVRVDDVSNSNNGVSQDVDATTIAAGLLYAFDNGLSPYVSYAESFEPQLGVDNVTGAALKPEEGEQFELGVKYQPAGSRSYVTLAYFDITQSNLPNPQGLPNAPSQQEGEASITGFEIEGVTVVELPVGDLKLNASASWLDAEDPNGQPFSSIPEEQASIWGEFSPTAMQDLRLGVGVRYLGDNESGSITTDGYTVADMMVGYDFENWSAMLNVRNLFDEEYYATCLARGDCFPGEERTVNLRVARRF